MPLAGKSEKWPALLPPLLPWSEPRSHRPSRFQMRRRPTMTMTGKPTDLNLEQWRREGIALGARAMFVVWDEFPFPPEAFPVYVGRDENLPERFAEFDGA